MHIDHPQPGPDSMPAITRRDFIKTAGSAIAAAAALSASPLVYAEPRVPRILPVATGTPESLVKTLFNTLSEGQKKQVCLPWTDPLRQKVDANWAIVEPSIGTVFNK